MVAEGLLLVKLMLSIVQNWEWRERCQIEVCHDWKVRSFVPIGNTFVMFVLGKKSLEGSCLSSGALEVRKSNTLQSLITLLASQSSAELHLRFQSTLYTNHHKKSCLPGCISNKREYYLFENLLENIFSVVVQWGGRHAGPPRMPTTVAPSYAYESTYD